MFKSMLLAGAASVMLLVAPASAATVSGTFTINIYNFNAGGVQGNANATAANVAAQGVADATVTYTGDLDFNIGSGNSNGTFISDFLESAIGEMYTVTAGTQAFLDGTLLSTPTFQTTTFFEIIGSFAKSLEDGVITHDDGVTLVANNQTGGVSAPPTVKKFTDFTAGYGAFTLYYAAANGNPSILKVEATPVPLPAGGLLLLAALGGLAAARRRSA